MQDAGILRSSCCKAVLAKERICLVDGILAETDAVPGKSG